MKIREPKTLTILVVVVAVAVLLIVAAAAYGAPACMTQAEARAQFPAAHLYWHTRHRCWDDRGPARPAKNYRPLLDPNGNVASVADVRWYPRPFDIAPEQLDPPVVLGVVEYRWPGSNLMDGQVAVIQPITVAAADEFNEIDAEADR